MLSNLVNAMGIAAFEKLFCVLIPIHKLAFFTTIFEVLAKNETLYLSDFLTEQFYYCTIRIYDLYFYKDGKEGTTWVNQSTKINCSTTVFFKNI
jgi:hypothetical protein